MIKSIKPRVWAFDLEWVPDPLAGRLVHRLTDDLTDLEVLHEMWRRGGATEDDPQPFLKTSLCRIVSVAAVERRERPDGAATVHLMSLPRNPDDELERLESHVVGTFLEALSSRQPQIVGFNSSGSDVPILLQRGLMLGLSAPGFCSRPDKPWEGIDYFARSSDWHVDLKDAVGSWGMAAPSLHELAVQSGIPGKMDVDGQAVANLWLADDLRKIIAYNEFDALTTYLVWLRLVHLAGLIDGGAYEREQQSVTDLIQQEIGAGKIHLQSYLEEWNRLRSIIADNRSI